MGGFGCLIGWGTQSSSASDFRCHDWLLILFHVSIVDMLRHSQFSDTHFRGRTDHGIRPRDLLHDFFQVAVVLVDKDAWIRVVFQNRRVCNWNKHVPGNLSSRPYLGWLKRTHGWFMGWFNEFNALGLPPSTWLSAGDSAQVSRVVAWLRRRPSQLSKLKQMWWKPFQVSYFDTFSWIQTTLLRWFSIFL